MEHILEVAGISDEVLRRLDERASRRGVDRSSYVRSLIEEAVAPPSPTKSLAELLAPVHEYTETQGMSEKEIEDFLGEQLRDSRRERRGIEESGSSTQ